MVFFLLDRKAPAQRHTRRSANVASCAACRGVLMVDYGSNTKDRSDRNLRKPKKKNSLQRQAGAYWSRKKKPLYIL